MPPLPQMEHRIRELEQLNEALVGQLQGVLRSVDEITKHDEGHTSSDDEDGDAESDGSFFEED